VLQYAAVCCRVLQRTCSITIVEGTFGSGAYKFSKVSYFTSADSKFGSGLTFEKFVQVGDLFVPRDRYRFSKKILGVEK